MSEEGQPPKRTAAQEGCLGFHDRRDTTGHCADTGWTLAALCASLLPSVGEEGEAECSSHCEDDDDASLHRRAVILLPS